MLRIRTHWNRLPSTDEHRAVLLKELSTMCIYGKSYTIITQAHVAVAQRLYWCHSDRALRERVSAARFQV